MGDGDAADTQEGGRPIPDAHPVGTARRGCSVPILVLCSLVVGALFAAGALSLVIRDDHSRRSLDAAASGSNQESASSSTSTSASGPTSSTSAAVTTTVKSNGSGASATGTKSMTTTTKPMVPTIDTYYALPNPAECDSSKPLSINVTFS
ncbi:MAG: hypothetical protein FJW86_06480 [Actinobacteria bacterium]|nr:hypothetical protein [Actinomycetota bacterium]